MLSETLHPRQQLTRPPLRSQLDLVERETFDVNVGRRDGFGCLCGGELQQARTAYLDAVLSLFWFCYMLDVLGDGFVWDAGELLGAVEERS